MPTYPDSTFFKWFLYELIFTIFHCGKDFFSDLSSGKWYKNFQKYKQVDSRYSILKIIFLLMQPEIFRKFLIELSVFKILFTCRFLSSYLWRYFSTFISWISITKAWRIQFLFVDENNNHARQRCISSMHYLEYLETSSDNFSIRRVSRKLSNFPNPWPFFCWWKSHDYKFFFNHRFI